MKKAKKTLDGRLISAILALMCIAPNSGAQNKKNTKFNAYAGVESYYTNTVLGGTNPVFNNNIQTSIKLDYTPFYNFFANFTLTELVRINTQKSKWSGQNTYFMFDIHQDLPYKQRLGIRVGRESTEYQTIFNGPVTVFNYTLNTPVAYVFFNTANKASGYFRAPSGNTYELGMIANSYNGVFKPIPQEGRQLWFAGNLNFLNRPNIKLSLRFGMRIGKQDGIEDKNDNIFETLILTTNRFGLLLAANQEHHVNNHTFAVANFNLDDNIKLIIQTSCVHKIHETQAGVSYNGLELFVFSRHIPDQDHVHGIVIGYKKTFTK